MQTCCKYFIKYDIYSKGLPVYVCVIHFDMRASQIRISRQEGPFPAEGGSDAIIHATRTGSYKHHQGFGYPLQLHELQALVLIAECRQKAEAMQQEHAGKCLSGRLNDFIIVVFAESVLELLN